MLSSITPLGERARGNRWALTAMAYVAGSVVGGAGVGAALGSVGMFLTEVPLAIRLAVAGGAALLGAGIDMTSSRLSLPTVHRQVDEAWLRQYRGWVYGAGFGVQLGAGMATIVTSAATYVAFALSLLSGSALAGALIGGAFGLVRAAPISTVRQVKAPEPLRRLHRQLLRLEGPGHWTAVASQAAVGAALVAGAVAAGARVS